MGWRGLLFTIIGDGERLFWIDILQKLTLKKFQMNKLVGTGFLAYSRLGNNYSAKHYVDLKSWNIVNLILSTKFSISCSSFNSLILFGIMESDSSSEIQLRTLWDILWAREYGVINIVIRWTLNYYKLCTKRILIRTRIIKII